MSLRPYRDIDRRPSRRVNVGAVPVGDGAPITVPSMTNSERWNGDRTRRLTALNPAGFAAGAVNNSFNGLKSPLPSRALPGSTRLRPASIFPLIVPR